MESEYVCTCGPDEYCAADDCHGATGEARSAAWIVVVPANKPSGVAEIVGPFESFQLAEEYAHGDDLPVGTWWTKLTPPRVER